TKGPYLRPFPGSLCSPQLARLVEERDDFTESPKSPAVAARPRQGFTLSASSGGDSAPLRLQVGERELERGVETERRGDHARQRAVVAFGAAAVAFAAAACVAVGPANV